MTAIYPVWWKTGPNGEQIRTVTKVERWPGGKEDYLYIVEYEAGKHRGNRIGFYALTPEEFSEFTLNIPEDGWG